jgi:hypothetical protein
MTAKAGVGALGPVLLTVLVFLAMQARVDCVTCHH